MQFTASRIPVGLRSTQFVWQYLRSVSQCLAGCFGFAATLPPTPVPAAPAACPAANTPTDRHVNVRALALLSRLL